MKEKGNKKERKKKEKGNHWDQVQIQTRLRIRIHVGKKNNRGWEQRRAVNHRGIMRIFIRKFNGLLSALEGKSR